MTEDGNSNSLAVIINQQLIKKENTKTQAQTRTLRLLLELTGLGADSVKT